MTVLGMTDDTPLARMCAQEMAVRGMLEMIDPRSMRPE